MAIIKCRDCGNEVSTDAEKCPKCGAVPSKLRAVGNAVGGVLIVGVVVWYLFGGGFVKAGRNMSDDVFAQVSRDSVAQYEMVKRNGGSAVDLCVQAGFVAAAYLQAKDEANYKRWSDQERSDCAKAGIAK